MYRQTLGKESVYALKIIASLLIVTLSTPIIIGLAMDVIPSMPYFLPPANAIRLALFAAILGALGIFMNWLALWLSHFFRDLLFLRMKSSDVKRILSIQRLTNERFYKYLTKTRFVLYAIVLFVPLSIVTAGQTFVDPRSEVAVSQMALDLLVFSVSLLFVSVDVGNLSSRALLDVVRSVETPPVHRERKEQFRLFAKQRGRLLVASLPLNLSYSVAIIVGVFLVPIALKSTIEWYYVGSISWFLNELTSTGNVVTIYFPLWFASAAGVFVLGYFVIPTVQLLGYRYLVWGLVAFAILFLVDTVIPQLVSIFFPPFVPAIITALVTFALLYILSSGLEHAFKEEFG